MAQNRETRTVQNPALLEVGARPDVLVWRQQVGVFRAYDNPDRVVKVGIKGMADSGMIVAVTVTPEMVGKTIGVAVQPEFKVANGKQREHQEDWQRAVEKRGGVYRVVRTPAEMAQLVEDVKNGRAWS